jgi:hypothetical protein
VALSGAQFRRSDFGPLRILKSIFHFDAQTSVMAEIGQSIPHLAVAGERCKFRAVVVTFVAENGQLVGTRQPIFRHFTQPGPKADMLEASIVMGDLNWRRELK